MVDERMPPPPEPAADAVALVAELTRRGLTVAVAESLTGGLLTAAIVAVPGASVALNGGVVAYATPLKSALLGVDERLLDERGAVDPDVARAMADGVRHACAVDGRPADLGLATTGVAGPDQQDGHEPGTAFVAVSGLGPSESMPLRLTGDRAAIRAATVEAALRLALARLA